MRLRFSTPHVFSPGICLMTLLLAVPAASIQQARQPRTAGTRQQVWWAIPPQGDAERGRLEEIKDKRRIYVSFFAFTERRDADEIRRHVLRALGSYGGVELVSSAEQADFALYVSAKRLPPRNPRVTGQTPSFSDAPLSLPDVPPWPTDLEVSALVKGAGQPDGANRPRLVWQKSQEAWSHVGPEAASVVNAFIRQLEKVRRAK